MNTRLNSWKNDERRGRIKSPKFCEKSVVLSRTSIWNCF